jgi:uncharacterized membrane protein
MLVIGSILSLSMLYFRMEQSSTLYYRFFVWNLLLAWIPLLLSFALIEMDKRKIPTWICCLILFAWLLFFPNSPYMLTDLFHLSPKHQIPVWYDLGMILSFAWNGLMLGFVSLLGVQEFIQRRTAQWITWIIVTLILILAAFGIYLGRYERLNSWDILTNPIGLFKEISPLITHPLNCNRTVGVTLVFSSFLLVSYLTLYLLIYNKNRENIRSSDDD